MKNCYGCSSRQNMGDMVGCKEKCKIIIDPGAEKDCFKSDVLETLRKQCNLPEDFWQSIEKR